MGHILMLPAFRVAAGADAFYFASKEVFDSKLNGYELSHLAQLGLFLLVVFVVIEVFEFAGIWRRVRRASRRRGIAKRIGRGAKKPKAGAHRSPSAVGRSNNAGDAVAVRRSRSDRRGSGRQ